MTGSDSNQPFRVLSIDGGGLRGIYTAEYLNRICCEQAKIDGRGELDLGKGFDLIVGTSTGAIIGCAAAMGIPMSDVVDLFKSNGRLIFPHRIKGNLSGLLRIFCGGYFVRKGDKALRQALTGIFGNTTLRESYEKRGISICIPAVHMFNHQSWVFKSNLRNGGRDDNYLLADACLASSAAPIYRSLAVVNPVGSTNQSKKVFADGGLWANNPILVAMIEAIKTTNLNRPMEIFSIGTCPKREGEIGKPKSEHRSIAGWRFGADVGLLSMDAQGFAFENMARLLSTALNEKDCKIDIIRFPSNSPPSDMIPYLGLDDTRKKAMNWLLKHADSDADFTRSMIREESCVIGQKIRVLLEDLPERENLE